MATILDKTITRDSGNIINTNTNYSELNTKASGLVNDIVSHVETQIQTTETALQASENLVDAKIASLLSVGDTGYTKDVVDTNFANQINALAPYSGYTKVSKKLDNFVFKEDANFTYSVADKNRFVKFGDKVVDTYGEELVDNGDFSDGTTGWNIYRSTYIETEDGIELTATGNGGGIYQDFNSVTGIVSITYRQKPTSSLAVLSSTGTISETKLINDGNWHNLKVYGVNITRIWIRENSTDDAVFEISNISVKEIQTADFTNTIPEVAEIIQG